MDQSCPRKQQVVIAARMTCFKRTRNKVNCLSVSPGRLCFQNVSWQRLVCCSHLVQVTPVTDLSCTKVLTTPTASLAHAPVQSTDCGPNIAFNQAERRPEEFGLPEMVHQYHSLCPVEDMHGAAEQPSAALGVCTMLIRAASPQLQGQAVTLRRLDPGHVCPCFACTTANVVIKCICCGSHRVSSILWP